MKNKNWTPSKMGKAGYKARIQKYEKEYFNKHAEMMRNAKKVKKASKNGMRRDIELST